MHLRKPVGNMLKETLNAQISYQLSYHVSYKFSAQNPSPTRVLREYVEHQEWVWASCLHCMGFSHPRNKLT
jgi:hypothetical protein